MFCIGRRKDDSATPTVNVSERKETRFRFIANVCKDSMLFPLWGHKFKQSDTISKKRKYQIGIRKFNNRKKKIHNLCTEGKVSEGVNLKAYMRRGRHRLSVAGNGASDDVMR